MGNEIKLEMDALPENEGFARVAVAAFVTPLNPTMEEISDVKTAVSAWRGICYIWKSRISERGFRM